MKQLIVRPVILALRAAGYELMKISKAPPVPEPDSTAPEPDSNPPLQVVADEPQPIRALGLTENTVGVIQPLPDPVALDDLARLYSSFSLDGKEIISRAVMNRAILDDRFSIITRWCNDQSELHRQAEAAVAFGLGDLDRCTDILDRLRSTFPTPFNQMCYGKSLVAMNRLKEAIEHFASADRADFVQGMELATLLFWTGATAQANDVLARYIHRYDDEREEVRSRQAELEFAIKRKQIFRNAPEEFIKDDDVINTWWSYWRTFAGSPFREPNAALDGKIRQEVYDNLANLQATSFIGFGTLSAFTVHAIAKRFPEIRFIGIDRPEVSRDLCERFYRSPNLKFVAGDLLKEIDRWDDLGDNAVLFHSRTAIYCYPDYMRTLYRKAREKGVRHIMFQEGDTFSRAFGKFFDYGQYPDIAVTSRSKIIMHDYQKLMRETGFEIVSTAPVNPNFLFEPDKSNLAARHLLVHAVARSN